MVIPRYNGWILDDISREQQIEATRNTMLPALNRLCDGEMLTQLVTSHAWLRDFFSTIFPMNYDQIDAAYAASPNESTFTLSELVDVFYGTSTTVFWQTRMNEGNWLSVLGYIF